MNLNLRLVRHYIKARNKCRGVFYRNPVLSLGLAMPFAVVCSNSLKNAAIMSICMFFTLIPTILIASIYGKKIAPGLYFVVFPTIAALIMIPVTLLVTPISANISDSLGFYLQILAVNSLLIYSIRPCIHMVPRKAAAYSFMSCLGFTLVMACLAFVRELFGNGTLWGIPVIAANHRLYGLLFPFAGFIMIGFFAALTRAINRKIYQLLIHVEVNRAEEKRVLATARSMR